MSDFPTFYAMTAVLTCRAAGYNCQRGSMGRVICRAVSASPWRPAS